MKLSCQQSSEFPSMETSKNVNSKDSVDAIMKNQTGAPVPPEMPPTPTPTPQKEKRSARPRNLLHRKIVVISVVIIVILSGVAAYFALSPPLPGKYVRITYNMHRLSQIGSQTPQPGFVYLVLNMTIYNHGYVEFDLYFTYLGVQIDGRVYEYSLVSLDLNQSGYPAFNVSEILPSVPILKEQTLTGAVAFEVPSNYSQSIPIYPYADYLKAWTGDYVILWTKS